MMEQEQRFIQSKAELGERLKNMRYKANISQTQMAKMLGISQGHYSDYETGLAEPNILTLIKIAGILDCDINLLITKNRIQY